jgi:hypothetical protein
LGCGITEWEFRELEDVEMARATKKEAPVAKQEVAKVEETGGLPAYLQNKARSVSIGNTDQSDLIMPRVKLLQAVSPEINEHNDAKQGHFWHSLAEVDLGETLEIIPILVRKSLVLWAPRGDDRGVLARSNDCINWDRPDETFEVKIKGSPQKQKWRIGNSVRESGLTEFGSSIDGDPNSQPAAALTYSILSYLPAYPDMPLAILLNTRSSVKSAKMLISKIEMANMDQFALKFTVTPRVDKGAEGDYFNYAYTRSGFATEEQYKYCAERYETFKTADFRANDEGDEHGEAGGATQAPKTSTGADRF